VTRPSAAFMLLVAAFFWGSGNVFNKTVLDHVGPLTAVSLRCLIAALVVTPFAWGEPRVAVARANMSGSLGVSALFCVAMALQQVAFQTATVTNVSFLVQTCSILTPIIAWFALRERPHARIVCAGMITLVGAFLMTGASFSFAAMNRGDLLCLISAIFYAAWMVALGRHLALFQQPFTISLVQFAVSTAVLLPIAIMAEHPQTPALVDAAPQLLVLGLFSTGLAFVLQTCAQQQVSCSTAAIIVSAESLFGAALAYVWLGEQTPALGLAGAALILTGIVIAAVSAVPQVLPQRP
jgi:drug/metabolite transporter (DMT)-like permease